MRLWHLHPSYLDRLELVATWCEGLSALNILRNEPIGSKRYPQLQKFKDSQYGVDYMILYLWFIYKESETRGYKFDKTRLGISVDDQIWFSKYDSNKLPVTIKQIEFEFNHLYKKFLTRDKEKAEKLMQSVIRKDKSMDILKIKQHPIFSIVEGEIEEQDKSNNVR